MPTHFRELLRETLVARCRANRAYSLRAFAKQLGLEPSYLSKLLSGKRNVTENTILKTAPKLSLDPKETDGYLERVRANKGSGVRTLPKKQEFQNLAVDQFRIVADWYHYAILELLLLKDFRHDPAWIAKKLRVSRVETELALERLERLQMLIRTESGKYRLSPGNYSTIGNDFTAVAFRRLQQQVLTQALAAIESTPLERRDQSSMTMAIDASQLPEAKRRIKKFRRELTAFLQENDRPKNQVYQLSVSFFPVTDRD